MEQRQWSFSKKYRMLSAKPGNLMLYVNIISITMGSMSHWKWSRKWISVRAVVDVDEWFLICLVFLFDKKKEYLGEREFLTMTNEQRIIWTVNTNSNDYTELPPPHMEKCMLPQRWFWSLCAQSTHLLYDFGPKGIIWLITMMFIGLLDEYKHFSLRNYVFL